jgi:hypothetical protein
VRWEKRLRKSHVSTRDPRWAFFKKTILTNSALASSDRDPAFILRPLHSTHVGCGVTATKHIGIPHVALDWAALAEHDAIGSDVEDVKVAAVSGSGEQP